MFETEAFPEFSTVRAIKNLLIPSVSIQLGGTTRCSKWMRQAPFKSSTKKCVSILPPLGIEVLRTAPRSLAIELNNLSVNSQLEAEHAHHAPHLRSLADVQLLGRFRRSTRSRSTGECSKGQESIRRRQPQIV